ncbi:MAG: hypothetical protein ACYS26_07135 [Planctomycetota bacterium]|jgi:hypothetical protein
MIQNGGRSTLHYLANDPPLFSPIQDQCTAHDLDDRDIKVGIQAYLAGFCEL